MDSESSIQAYSINEPIYSRDASHSLTLPPHHLLIQNRWTLTLLEQTNVPLDILPHRLIIVIPLHGQRGAAGQTHLQHGRLANWAAAVDEGRQELGLAQRALGDAATRFLIHERGQITKRISLFDKGRDNRMCKLITAI